MFSFGVGIQVFKIDSLSAAKRAANEKGPAITAGPSLFWMFSYSRLYSSWRLRRFGIIASARIEAAAVEVLPDGD